MLAYLFFFVLYKTGELKKQLGYGQDYEWETRKTGPRNPKIQKKGTKKRVKKIINIKGTLWVIKSMNGNEDGIINIEEIIEK